MYASIAAYFFFKICGRRAVGQPLQAHLRIRSRGKLDCSIHQHMHRLELGVD